MRTLALPALVAICVAGCVVYPTQRTYFEPNVEDGTLSSSSSCGYHDARNDSLVREVNGLHLQVSPSLVEGKPVAVTVLFRHQSVAAISPERFELRSLPSGIVYFPVSHEVNIQKPDRSHPYYSKWLHLQFSVLPEAVTEIAVVFPAGSVTLDGVVVNLAPFRFRKTTKNDVYYASINC